MNRIFRLVFNRTLGQVQVASELASRHRVGAGGATRLLAPRALLAVALALAGGSAWAQVASGQLPTGETVVGGAASITRDSAANLLRIVQNGRTVIDWTSFDIGAEAHVDFVQSAGSIALNRVTGGTPSQILGRLEADAGIFLINPSGVLFGSGAQVNVGSLMVSTLSPQAGFGGEPIAYFLSGGNQLSLAQSGNPGLIRNEGTIVATNGGSISLIGGSVQNRGSGTITADGGAVHLVAAGQGTLTLGSTHDVTVTAGTAAASGASVLVDNAGTLQSNGGQVTLAARGIPADVATAVNTTGVILATDLGFTGGKITLDAGTNHLNLGGQVTASSTLTASTSGTITLRGDIGAGTFMASGGTIEQVAGTVDTPSRLQSGGTSLAASGDITLANTGNRLGGITAFQGRNVSLRSDGGIGIGVHSQGSSRAAGNLTLDAGGAITQTGALIVAGSTSLDARGDAIVLANGGNDFVGAVGASGNGITLRDANNLTVSSISNATDSTLSLTAGGTLTLPAGAIDTGSADLVLFAGRSLSTPGALRGHSVHLHGSDGLTLAHDVAGTAAVRLSSSGAVEQSDTARIQSPRLALDAASADLGGANAISAFGDIVVNGALTLRNAQGIAQAAGTSVRVGGATTIRAAGNVLLDNPTNRFGGALSLTGNAVEIGGEQLRLVHVDATSLVATADGIELSGTFETTGGQRYAGAVRLVGATVVDAGGNVSFVQTVDGAQLLTIDAGGAVAMSGAVGATTALAGLTIDAAGFTAGGTLQTSGDTSVSIAAGTIVQQGAFLVGGDARFATGNGDITLANAGNRFAGPVSLTGRNVQIRDSASLRFGALDVGSLWAIAPQLLLPGSLSTVGMQYYDGSVTLDRDSHLTSALGAIVLGGTVDGPYALTVDAGMDVTFEGAVGSGTALSSLDTRGTSLTRIGADITTSGDIAFGNTLVGAAQATVRSSAGAVTVAGSLEAAISGQGTLTLEAHDALTLSDTAGAARALADLTLDGGSVSTRGIRVANALRVTSGGDIVQNGVYDVGGNAHFVAAGDIALGEANRFAGTVSLDGADAVVHAASVLALDTVDVDSLGARSAGTLSLSDARIAGDATLQGNGLSLTDFDIGGDLGATAGSGGIALADGRVRGDLAADSGSDITQTAALHVEGDARFAAGSARIALTHADNDFEGAVDLAGGAVSVNDRNALRLGIVDAGSLDVASHGALDLGTTTLTGGLTAQSNGGAITQSAALHVEGDARFDAGTARIALGHADNDFEGAVDLAGGAVSVNDRNALRLGIVDAGSLDVASHGALDLGTTTLTGGLTAQSNGGAITQSGDLVAAGASIIDARGGGGAGDITLTRAGNVLGGPLTLAGRDVAVAANALWLAGVDARNLLAIADTIALRGDVTTDEDQDYAGVVQLESDVTLDAGGHVAFAASVDGAHALDVRSDGHAGFGGAVAVSALTVEAGSAGFGSTVATGGNLTVGVQAGGIAQSDAFTVGGIADFDANGGTILLTHADNDFAGRVHLRGGAVAISDANALALGTVSAGSLVADSHDTLDLGTATVAGILEARSNGGDIVQTGALAVGGTSLLDAAGGNIVLDLPENDFGGAVTVSGGTVALRDVDDLTLAAVTVGEDLTVTSHGALDLGAGTVGGQLTATSHGGSIVQSGALTIAGTSTIDAGTGAVTLDDAQNDFVGRVDITGGTVTIADRDRLVLGAVDADSLHATATSIALQDDISTRGDQDYAGAVAVESDVSLVASAGGIGFGSTVSGPHRVAIDAAGHVGFGAAVALGALGIEAGSAAFASTVDIADRLDVTVQTGGIQQSGAFTVGGDTRIDANGGAITLAHTGNDFVGTVHLDGGNVRIHDANALTLSRVDAQALDVTSNGALVFGETDVDETLVADSGTGSIGQTESLTVGGTASFTSGAGIALTHDGNDFKGAVSLAGTTVAIRDANALTLGTVDAQALDVTSNGALVFGETDVDETLVADSGTGSIGQTESLSVVGTASFTSGAGIALTHDGNDFGGAVSLAGTTVAIHDANALTLGTVDARTFDVSSDGALVFGRTDIEETLVADSGTGTIGQTDALSVVGTASFTSGAGIALTHADNDFGGAVSLDGTMVAIRDANALTLGTVDARTFDVSSDGALVFGRTDIEETLVAGSGTGSIGQTDALTVGGTASFTSGAAIDLTHADNDFGGAVSLDGTMVAIRDANALTLGQVEAQALDVTSNGALVFGETDVDETLVADSGAGSIGQTDALTVAGTASFTSGDAIDLTHDGNDFGGAVSLAGTTVAIRDANALTLGRVEAQALDVTSNGALVFGETDVDETLVADSGTGSIGQTEALSVGGTASFTSGAAIDLTHADNDFGGAVSLDGTTVAIRDANALTLGMVDARTLDVTSNGALFFGRTDIEETLIASSGAGSIGQTDALTVAGTASFTSGAGIDLTHADNDFGGVVSLDGTTVAIRDANALTLGTVDARTLDVTSNGALVFGRTDIEETLIASSGTGSIGQTDTLTVAGTASFTSGAGIDLTHADNDFGGAVSLAGTTVAIRDANALTLGRVDAQALDVRSHGDLDLGTTTVAGTLVANSHGGAIGQSGALFVGGASTVDAGVGDITLDNAGNDFVGRVDIIGGAVRIADANTLALGRVDAARLRAIAGTIVLHGDIGTGGDQDYDGDVVLATDVDLASRDGGIAFASTVSGAHALGVRAAGHVGFGGDVALAGLVVDGGSFRADGTVTLDDGAGGGDLSIAAGTGGIAQSGAFRVGGTATLDANGGDIALTDGDNDFAGAVHLAGNDVAIRDANALTIGTLDVGTLAVTSRGALDLGAGAIADTLVADSNGGAIAQSGALTVGGDARIDAGAAAITLDNAGNDFAGRVHLTGGTVSIADANALTLGTVRADALTVDSHGALAFGDVAVQGALEARSHGGTVIQTGALRVGAATRLDAGAGDIVLDHAGNDFVGAVDASGGAISLRDANDLVVERLASGTDRDVRLVAGRALTLPAHALDTGRGSLTLAAHGGTLTTRGALGGSDVALHGASGIAIGHDIDAAGTLVLESGADIAQGGGRIAAGTLTGSAAGGVRLDGANRIATLGAFSANGVRLSNAQSLAIAGPVSAGDSLLLAVDGDLAIDGRVAAGDMRLETTGAITQGADGPLVARTLSGRAGGAVSLGDAAGVVDNQVERIGDFTARAGFSLTNGRSLTLASLNGSRFTIDAGTADFYLSVVGDLRQDGTDWLYNGRGTWAATGGIGLPASPIYVTATEQQRVAAIGLPPAYFYALRPDGSLLPIVGEASVNVPTSVWAGRAQSSSNRQVAYVDVGADASNYRPYGVVEPGIRLSEDQTPECDPDFPSDECVEAVQ
ncbi:filamentous hemagglutinin N-terminal domain-containing protein [Luteimonas sp. BDR2-5]|uniref:two-partner secretion domain-containing protein n=1 Tax=Proluteimonas luteida TaxID=2878685 RepID=UPI001E610484|nr:filamentous hemagglutinin N-terminal domain-containing protein [Luteimonas sp. BDR2-5]MCD9027882.1 filamentous hemagglutinin N-terminal domain-containing protein [Luteimonas sp. BDR2-5]